MMANRMPREGRMVLTPMLNPNGRLIGDFTIAKLGAEEFIILGSGIAENFHLRWFEAHLPEDGSVQLRCIASELTGFSIAEPNSRELLSRLTHDDVSKEAFPFLSFRKMELGLVPALVGRITFTGDLGYEIWVRPDFQLALYEAILAAGEDLGLRHFGGRALNSMRLEKSFGSWTREFTPDYTPLQANLDRFVDLRKNQFVGRDAVLREKEEGPSRKLITLNIDAEGIDAVSNEPVWHDGNVVGWVTSAGYGNFVDKSIALAYVPSEALNGGAFEVEILGERYAATRSEGAFFDPEGSRMRS